MNKKTVAIDLDNVIWDMSTPWVEIYNLKYHDNIDPDNLPEYNMVNVMKKADSDDIYSILDSPTFWEMPTLLEGAYEYIKELNKEYNVVIITKTHFKNANIKSHKLLQYLPFLDFKQIIIAFDKSLIDYDILIDDNPEFLDKNKKGIIMDWSYNRYCEDFPRCYSWKSVYETVHLLLDKED